MAQTSVKIEQSTLFVGSTAYPLHGIVGVQSQTWVVNRDAIKREFIKRVVITSVLALCFGGGAFSSNSGGQAVGVLVLAAAAGIIALFANSMRKKLATPPVYTLTIQNAANSQNLIYSRDSGTINRIVNEIIASIHDRTRTLAPVLIETLNIAGRDLVQQDGSFNTITTNR